MIISFNWEQTKRRKQLYAVILLFIGLNTYSQKVTYNQILDTTNTETKEIMQLFENYLASDPNKKEKNLFWNSQEQETYENYDFLKTEFQPSLYMGFPAHVLSIKKQQDAYAIKVQYGQNKKDQSPYVLAIANYMAKKENGAFKLYNMLNFNKKKWQCTAVGIVDFYYPSYHNFDYQKAEKLNDFITEICKIFKVTPKPFEYYFANDFDEIQELKGLDYYLGEGGTVWPSGGASEDKVYSGGLGEYYPHEVFHVQIDAVYPNKHNWVSEGIATLLGGSRGKSLQWHIHRTNDYLQEHPQIDLSNMLQLTNVDNRTAYRYVLGGLIAKKIKDKGDWPLLKAFMTSGTTDADYYKAIYQYLGVSRSELNSYLRKQLKAESENDAGTV